MAGIYGGIQALLKRKNKKAICIGAWAIRLACTVKTLLLVTFLDTLVTIFYFFAASTNR